MSTDDPREQAPEVCPRCNGARWVASDAEWPHPTEDRCPACTDGWCTSCPEPGIERAGNGEEWCDACWDSDPREEARLTEREVKGDDA